MKTVDYDAYCLAHPKLQSLMAAFKKGTGFEFSITDKGKSPVISANEAQVRFNDQTMYQFRALIRYESDRLVNLPWPPCSHPPSTHASIRAAVLRSPPDQRALRLCFRPGGP